MNMINCNNNLKHKAILSTVYSAGKMIRIISLIIMLIFTLFINSYAQVGNVDNDIKQNTEVGKIINGKWLDRFANVLIEFHYPTKISNMVWDDGSINYGDGTYNYFKIFHNREIPIESGKFQFYLKNDELWLTLVNNFSRGVRNVRIDYYDQNRLELFYENYRIKVFLDKFSEQPSINTSSKIQITSEPSDAAVYANHDYIGQTPLKVELEWYSSRNRIELRFEKSRYITNRRMITPEEEKVHVVLQPIW